MRTGGWAGSKGAALTALGNHGLRVLPSEANFLLAPPLMVVTMLIARNPKVMGKLTISRRLAFGGWLSTAVMWIVAGVFLLS